MILKLIVNVHQSNCQFSTPVHSPVYESYRYTPVWIVSPVLPLLLWRLESMSPCPESRLQLPISGWPKSRNGKWGNKKWGNAYSIQQLQLPCCWPSLCSHMHLTSMAGWQGIACIVVVYHPLTIALFTALTNMGTRLLSETARKLTSYFSKALSQNHDHQKTSLATPSNVFYMSLQWATSYFCTQNPCHRTMTTRRPA